MHPHNPDEFGRGNCQIENATNPAAQTYTRKNFACLSQKWSRLFSEWCAIGSILFEKAKMASCTAPVLLTESRLAFHDRHARADAGAQPVACKLASVRSAPKETRRTVVNARETIPYSAPPPCLCRL
ncbi:hypothetical protein DIE07_08505 [Burkholderia sp. Bp9002]|nr:hypothetical protein DIE18_11910 [Burkholderia sp. Bp9125]RQS13099.1 hypothetical protein DIE07_08505 [Burkholderia sp. Bp9002]